jgi:YD repeat-containing protein
MTADAGGMDLVTTNTYNVFGNLLTRKLPSATTGTSRTTTTMTYDLMNRAVTVRDPAGSFTGYFYDDAGRRTELVNALNTPAAQTTSYEYDDLDRLLKTTFNDTTTTETSYYADGQIETRTDELGKVWTYNDSILTWSDSASVSYTSFVRTVTDPLAKTSTSYSRPMAWNSGVTRSVSAEGRVSESVTDAVGQTVLTRSAPGTTDATSTSYGYDDLGRRNSTTVDPGGLDLTTATLYDAIGRPINSTDPLNRTTSMAYANAVTGDTVDARTRSRVTTTLPDTRTLATRSDALGRQIASTDGKGQTHRYSYWYETSLMTELNDPKNLLTTLRKRGQTITFAICLFIRLKIRVKQEWRVIQSTNHLLAPWHDRLGHGWS